LIGLGALLLNTNRSVSSPKVEVLETSSESKRAGFEIVVEVVGAVQKPGVYELTSDARVEDALIAAGGVSAEADRAWMEKTLNRAARLVDGQKIYIPEVEESRQEGSVGGYQSVSSDRGSVGVNVNTASQKELEGLWGIGPVYAQNIIEQRPYSTVEELLTRKILKRNVYERNKDRLTVY